MSVLKDAVVARYAAKYLKEISNPQDQNASSINSTTIELAVTDITAMFPMYAEAEFDSTSQVHLSLGVKGVIALLEIRANQSSNGENMLRSFQDELTRLKMITSRQRIIPTNSGTTTEVSAFDPDNFADFKLSNPAGE